MNKEERIVRYILDYDKQMNYLFSEPDINKDDIEDVKKRRAHLLKVLVTRPWTKGMNELNVAAGFFRKVDQLNIWQKYKIMNVMTIMQNQKREYMLGLSKIDPIEPNTYLYPVSSRLKIKYSWPNDGSPEIKTIILKPSKIVKFFLTLFLW